MLQVPADHITMDNMATDMPVWHEVDETPQDKQYIFSFHMTMCQKYAKKQCSGSAAQCFGYHAENSRRRPLFDAATGRMRYWDIFCERVAADQTCPVGDVCLFAHTQDEINYHAATYKTMYCNDPTCNGKDNCCYAHDDKELRTLASQRYSYWWCIAQQTMYMPNDMGSYGSYQPAKASPKLRFCSSFPAVANCRRGDACQFAHSRTEIASPLLSLQEENQEEGSMTDDFFMSRFKTLWCPIGVQHDWQTCVYAHNYQDARRNPSIGYGPKPCPHWKRKETTLEYAERCPNGVRCAFSHGAKEQLYHPCYFKTVTCQDWPNARCPRTSLCAFFHRKEEQRAKAPIEKKLNYKIPLPEEQVSQNLQPDFLMSPFRSSGNDTGSFNDQDGRGNRFDVNTTWGHGVWNGHSQTPKHGTWNAGGHTPTTAAGDSDEATSAGSSRTSEKLAAAVAPPPFAPARGERQNRRNGGHANTNVVSTPRAQRQGRGAGHADKSGAGGSCAAGAETIDGFGNSAGAPESGYWGGMPTFFEPLPNSASQQMVCYEIVGANGEASMAQCLTPILEGPTHMPVSPTWAPMVPPYSWGAQVATSPAPAGPIFDGLSSPQGSPSNSPRGPVGQFLPFEFSSFSGFGAVTHTPRSDASGIDFQPGKQYIQEKPAEVEENIPTHNGFIHFKDGSDDGSAQYDQSEPLRGRRRVGSGGMKRFSSH